MGVCVGVIVGVAVGSSVGVRDGMSVGVAEGSLACVDVIVGVAVLGLVCENTKKDIGGMISKRINKNVANAAKIINKNPIKKGEGILRFAIEDIFGGPSSGLLRFTVGGIFCDVI